MTKDFKEILTELCKNEKKPDIRQYQDIIQTYGSPHNIEDFINFYERHEIFDNDRTKGLVERERLRGLLTLMIKNQSLCQDDTTLLRWAMSYGDAWKALLHVDIMSVQDGVVFDEEESNVLHLFFAREDINFRKDFYYLKILIQTNIGLFFYPNVGGLTPYDVLKRNANTSKDLLKNNYSIHSIFESKDDLIGMVYVAQWQERWERFLMIATDEMIQYVLNQGALLSIKEQQSYYNLYAQLDHHISVEELKKSLNEMRKNGKNDLEPSSQCNKMVEQSLIYMAHLLDNENLNDQQKKKRLAHIEEALIQDYFREEKAMNRLRDRLTIILKNEPDINVVSLKKVVGSIESRFSKKYEALSLSIRKKAIIASLFSVVLIGIPFAIYYWLQYQKTSKEAPVHVFHMPVSTYKKIIRYLDRDDYAVAEKVMSDKGNIKRAVHFLGGTQAAFFESKNADDKTILKVVCVAGDQTDNFEAKLDDLSFFDRFSVKHVL